MPSSVPSLRSTFGPPQMRGVADATLDKLRNRGRVVELLRGESQRLDGVCFLTSGHASLRVTLRTGQEHLASFIRPGTLVFGSPSNAALTTLTALENSQLITVGAAIFCEVVGSDLVATRKMLRKAIEGLGTLRVHATALARLTACERVAHFLAGLAGEPARSENRNVLLDLPMSRADLADHLGLTLETASRCVTRLKNLGLIDCPSRNAVTILDCASLANFSD